MMSMPKFTRGCSTRAFRFLVLAVFGAAAATSSTATRDRTLLAKYRPPNEIPFPEDNPFSDAKASLGRTLFFDPILSGAQVRSCSTCHNPGLSWADGLPRGIGEKPLPLRTPTLLNVAWVPKLGWTGTSATLKASLWGRSPLQAT